jgi:succinate dehydrogenase/fumarate reductase cytochrome b subunit
MEVYRLLIFGLVAFIVFSLEVGVRYASRRYILDETRQQYNIDKDLLGYISALICVFLLFYYVWPYVRINLY